MRRSSFAVASVLLASMTSMVMADNASGKAKAEVKKPDANPGWVVIEESWWYPLRFDAAWALDNARYHYRRNEEAAAANEIDRAVTWLKYAAGHAMPITKDKLDWSVKDLTALSADLREGRTAEAAKLDNSLGRASQALAEWHYFKAKESYGKHEEGYAAQNLEAAVAHLQHAANSAHFEFGSDTITLFDSIRKNGKTVTESNTFDHNLLGKHLDGIEQALKELGQTLQNASS
ncbi:MAG: hypothetical protein KDA87_23160 [Planctomycetales bacterium]|nr:hypothetical protein [Planctomycetales bacterium]